MNLVEPLLLAFSLSLDCFAISISQGLREDKNSGSLVILAVLFGLFQAGMFIAGYYTGTLVFAYFSKAAYLAAAGLLAFIGIKMIREGFEKESCEETKASKLKDYLFLSVATSIDAFAAGISFLTIKASFSLTSFLVGLISLVMALIGGFTGNLIGEKFGKRSEIIGGIVLLGLAVKTLITR